MSKIALNKLEVGEHWVIACKDSDNKTVNISANYHVGAEVQEGLRTFLKDLDGGEFSITGMVSETSNKIEISLVAIGTKGALENLSKAE